jgi:hypothetical protein
MKHVAILCLLVTVTVSGCEEWVITPPVSSIHGVGTEETIVACEGLMGVWCAPNDPNQEEMLEFEPGDSNDTFVIRIPAGNEETVEMMGTLVQLHDILVIDLIPRDKCDPYWAPLHTFAMVDIQESCMLVRPMDEDMVRQMLTDNASLLKHERNDKRVILTASPVELQQFFVTYGRELFTDDGLVFERK